MKLRTIQYWTLIAAFAAATVGYAAEGEADKAAPVASQANAEKSPTNDTAKATAAAEPAATNSEKSTTPPNISKSVADVAKLSKGGLDVRVIETYLDQAGSPLPPTADEIVYLREQGVSQDVIAALIRRGGAVRTQVLEIATQDDRVRDAMLEARQRVMFNRAYPPPAPPRGYLYNATGYGYEYYGGPVYYVPRVYRSGPPGRGR